MNEQLLKQAKSFFGANPDREIIYATIDGNFFWEKRHAENHASDITGEVYEIRRMNLNEEKKKPAGTGDGNITGSGKDPAKTGKDPAKSGSKIKEDPDKTK